MQIKNKTFHTLGIGALMANAGIIVWMFYLILIQGYARFIEPNPYILYPEVVLSVFGLFYAGYISIIIIKGFKK